MRYATEEDHAADVKTQEYLKLEQQDQHLVSWLLVCFTNCMVGCDFAHEIWGKLKEYFAAHTKSKIKQLKTQLKSIKQQGSTSEYLLKIRKITYVLAALGSPLFNDDYVEVILDGLNEDYSAFITMAMFQAQPFSVSELEALLVAQEDINERFGKTKLGSIQANVAQGIVEKPRDGMQQGGRGSRGRRGRGTGFRGVNLGTMAQYPSVSYVGSLGT